MQRIEIVITNDAGEASVIASTNRLDANSRIYCTRLHGYEDARRALTVSESMAVSRLCFGVGAHTFAIDPMDTACLAAARAYHEAGGKLKRGEGSAGTTPDGDTFIEAMPSPVATPVAGQTTVTVTWNGDIARIEEGSTVRYARVC